MQKIIGFIALFLASSVFAEGYIQGTFASDNPSSAIIVQEKGLVFVGSENGQDFGSGTVSVQFRGTDSEWYDSGITFTTSGVKNIGPELPVEVRLNLSGSTSPDLDYVIRSDSPVIIQ